MGEQSAQLKRGNLRTLPASYCDAEKETNSTSALCIEDFDRDKYVGTFIRGELKLILEQSTDN